MLKLFDWERSLKWFIAAPFSRETGDRWLGAFVPGNRHSFETVPAPYYHDRSRPRTSSTGWIDYLRHGIATYRKATAASCPAGIITCFPQLPLVIGLMQHLSRRKFPLVAWAFNLGHLPPGFRRIFSQWAFQGVSLFVVHSRAEVTAYSKWLGYPADRFLFVPLQTPLVDGPFSEAEEDPYVIAMGTAHRDYALLVECMRQTGYRTIIVAGEHAIAGLDLPSNVEVRSNISIEDCYRLLAGSRLSVTPLKNLTTASGQVTIIDAMKHAKAQVVTACPGTVDYLENGTHALLVPPGDLGAMRSAVQCLWEDRALRNRLGQQARQRVIEEFSDEVVGRILGSILDQLAPEES